MLVRLPCHLRSRERADKSSLILGPAFFSAWAYTILGYCIITLGPAFSLLKPKAYIAIFVTADIVCLILQAIGGGMAAVKAKTGGGTGPPTKISKSITLPIL